MNIGEREHMKHLSVNTSWLKNAIYIDALSIFLMLFITTVSLARPLLSPADPGVDRASECLMNTTVHSFTATPALIDPWGSTTLQWQVDIPSGCPLALYVSGQRVAPTGSLSVTPVWPQVSYRMVGKILGGSSTLAKTSPVNVDLSSCSQEELPEFLLRNTIEDVLNAYDKSEDKIFQIAPPQIEIGPRGLFIQMHLEVDEIGPNPEVVLKMRLEFVTRNGVATPHFTFFHPQASTYLPDDVVEGKFYDRTEDILDTFEQEVNNYIKEAVGDNKKLFSLETISNAVRVTLCDVVSPLPMYPLNLKQKMR